MTKKPKGSWFLTSYRENWAPISDDEDTCRPGLYSGFIWARNRRHANKLALLRGLGEIVIFERGNRKQPYMRASDVLRQSKGHMRGMYPKLHALSFLGMIALSSGAATIQEILGDRGIIHDMCHATSGDLAGIIARAAVIEMRVPGYWPGGSDGRKDTI